MYPTGRCAVCAPEASLTAQTLEYVQVTLGWHLLGLDFKVVVSPEPKSVLPRARYSLLVPQMQMDRAFA
jgi:hypothetical protein